MKKLEFETSNGRFVLVDSPIDSCNLTKGTHCIGVKTNENLEKDSNGFYHIYSNGLFFGDRNVNIEIIGFLKQITEEQASYIVNSEMSGTVLGKLVTDLDNHRVEIYNYEGNNIKFLSAVKCLHSLLKSKGIHLFENPVPQPEFVTDNFGNGGVCESWVKEFQEQEEKTFYNPVIFKL